MYMCQYKGVCITLIKTAVNNLSLMYIHTVCGLNVHKRCQQSVPCNCGINSKDLADVLKEMRITPEQLRARPSVSLLFTVPFFAPHVHIHISTVHVKMTCVISQFTVGTYVPSTYSKCTYTVMYNVLRGLIQTQTQASSLYSQWSSQCC